MIKIVVTNIMARTQGLNYTLAYTTLAYIILFGTTININNFVIAFVFS